MRFLLVVLLVLCFLGCYDLERNCKDYKMGRFYSEIAINDVIYKSEFERNDSIQVEHYNNHTDSSKIRWINDCEVVFKTINPKNRAEQKDIHLKILATTDSSYTFEYSYVGETKKQKGVAYRLD